MNEFIISILVLIAELLLGVLGIVTHNQIFGILLGALVISYLVTIINESYMYAK